MLEVEGLSVAYGGLTALCEVSLRVGEGQFIAIVGPNGAGKTTLFKAISGTVTPLAGAIRFDGRDLGAVPAAARAHLGIAHVPEGRQVFATLTARENLIATAANRGGAPDPWTLDKVLALFPRLAARSGSMANLLSGGEQQMLAIGRALMTNPRLLILDEATEGLSPLIRDEIWPCLQALRAAGQSILVIDKNVAALTRIADRHIIIERGRVVWTGTSAELAAAVDMQHRYLGV